MTSITRTIMVITSTDSEYEIQQDMSAAELVTTYSAVIPGLSNMVSTVDVQERPGVGTVRIVTFSPRTGTKG